MVDLAGVDARGVLNFECRIGKLEKIRNANILGGRAQCQYRNCGRGHVMVGLLDERRMRMRMMVVWRCCCR
eukprot:scaffold6804_cov57-Cyclotella_meneghiniana.AAC.9